MAEYFITRVFFLSLSLFCFPVLIFEYIWARYMVDTRSKFICKPAKSTIAMQMKEQKIKSYFEESYEERMNLFRKNKIASFLCVCLRQSRDPTQRWNSSEKKHETKWILRWCATIESTHQTPYTHHTQKQNEKNNQIYLTKYYSEKVKRQRERAKETKRIQWRW